MKSRIPKYFLLLVLIAPMATIAQTEPKCPSNMLRDSLYFCDLDSLNAFEVLHLLSDSTYHYGHCHQMIGGFTNDYGKYEKNGSVYTFYSDDTTEWNAAINMKMILITQEEINEYPTRNIFCDGRNQYFLLLSNENVNYMKYRMRLKDREYH